MNTPRGIIDVQLQALLDLVRRHRDERCRALQEQAEAKRRELLSEAYGDARRRMHQAVAGERQRMAAAITAARAQLQTRARQRRYQVSLGLLDAGWSQLRAAMRARWADRQCRGQWVKAMVDEALVVLPPGQWRLQVPVDWDPAEADDQLARVKAHCGHAPLVEAVDTLDAGLRFHADGACLDGSIEGLLINRTAIEARLLAELNRLLAREVPGQQEGTP